MGRDLIMSHYIYGVAGAIARGGRSRRAMEDARQYTLWMTESHSYRTNLFHLFSVH